MLVVCCGMLRSGSTVQYQLASELVEAAGAGTRVGWNWPSIDPAAARPGPPISVVKVHDPNPGVEALLDPDGVRYLYTYRDLRDVAVSYFTKNGRPEGALPEHALGWADAVLEAYRHFTTRRHALVSRYETFTADLPTEARRIRDFLALPLPDAQTDRVAAALALDRQRERITAAALAPGQAWDPRTLLHPDHIKDGRSGKWREQLSPADAAHIESRHGAWLRDRGYPLG